MNHIAPRAEPIVREIPLSRLALAPENVRKTPPDPQADASLKASIAALDLLENLVVRPNQTAEDGTERYAVVAGGRRLKAMQALVEEEAFDVDHPVLCQVRTGDAQPGEVSLAENVMRVPMHPADQVVAFSELAGAGQSVSAIAARFGASERVVEQRLRLGNAAQAESAAATDTAEARDTAASEAPEPAADTGPASTDAPPATGGNGHAAPAEPEPPAPARETGDAAPGDAGETAGPGAGPAVPEDFAAAIDTANRVPTADGGPRVVVAHVGPGTESDPAPANGHDPSGDPLEIPEFLRRVQ